MATLAIPAIESIAVRVLVALGVSLTAGAHSTRSRCHGHLSTLSWYFMEPKSYSHFASLFSVDYAGLEAVFEP
nr:hypothetical protein [Cupriavidus taiwanensis]